MDLQTILTSVYALLNDALLPLLMGVAMLVFLWNLTRFAIIGGASDEGRESARSLMIWGITAFVVMVSVWGIINLFAVGLGLTDNRPIIPDYVCEKGNLGNNCREGAAPPIP